ncbi:phospholipase [bacterium]|nr:phospholipase [bacterium]
MTITTQRISISKTARYQIMGKPSEKINSVWIVLHGYSQLAEDFVKYFKPLSNESTLVIAPEALNRFYVKGFDGKVGATWMTKEDRENEIKDYVNYLDSVYDEVTKHCFWGKVKITVLGFSQGTATACRWILKGKNKIDRLILWGGGIPQDVDLLFQREFFNSIDLTIVLGDKDEFVSEEQFKKQINLLNEVKLIHKVYRFTGKHEINAAALRQLI